MIRISRQKLGSFPRWSRSVVRFVFRHFGTGLCTCFKIQDNYHHYCSCSHSGDHWLRCILQCVDYSRFRQVSATPSYSVSGCWCSVPWWSVSFYRIFYSSWVTVFPPVERNCRNVTITEDCQPSSYSVPAGVEQQKPWQLLRSLWENSKAEKSPCQIAH